MFKLVLASVLTVFGAAANAEVPQAVTQAISTAQTDALTIGGAILAAIVTIYALKLARRAL
nr:MAG TPA: filamentous major capsid protein B [Inoviridae sp.]